MNGMLTWPVPDPAIPEAADQVLAETAYAAVAAFRSARETHGRANAMAGVPLSAFSAALAVDGVPVEALTCWFDTGRCWHAVAGTPVSYRTTGRTGLDGAAVSLLRPHRDEPAAWWRVARRAGRVRILSSTLVGCCGRDSTPRRGTRRGHPRPRLTRPPQANREAYPKGRRNRTHPIPQLG
jgi:hypothetical protein